MGEKVEIKKIMNKCKVISLFKVSWGTVAVLDFLKPTVFKLGDKLKGSNELFWVITGIARSKFTVNETYENLINSIYVWDCTIQPINHAELPLLDEELSLVEE